MDPSRNPSRRRPEILAPAGDPLSFRAALAAGADAVYLGMARFNARGRAERFKGVELGSCIATAHERGARVYVTLNTLIHDDELGRALDLAAEARAAGADAAIVQDAGFAALLREKLPDFALHGSTQMTVHSPEQAAEAASRLGLKRIILARECSTTECGRIAERLRPLGAEAEVFVHGALCFAYSGQCLMSNFAGRRSANRGICAQNCRFDFTSTPPEPIDPQSRAAGAGGLSELPVFAPRTAVQLISMKDLAAFDAVAALADSGIASFKIEGRLKGPEYVAEVVRLYRAALDAWEARRPFAAAEAEHAAGRVFSRGFTSGYLSGRIDASMRGDKRSLEGEPDARVVSANRHSGQLVLEPRVGHAVKAGQGYRYAHDRYRSGFRVLEARAGGDGRIDARVRFGSDASGRRYRRGATGRSTAPPPLPVGLALYLNDDPELEARIGRLVASVRISTTETVVGLRMAAWGKVGEPLCLSGCAPDGREAEVRSREPLEAARAHPLDLAILSEHLGRLGGTGYRLDAIEVESLEARAFLPFPELHALRRALVEALGPARGRRPAISPSVPSSETRFEIPERTAARSTVLTVCVASPEALEAALAAGAGRVVIEDERLLAGDPARQSLWEGVRTGGRGIWFRLPPIVHTDESDERTIERIREGWPGAGILAGHLGQLARARAAGIPAAADLYLNAYNHRTVQVLREAGAARVTLSLEVDAAEAARVAARCESAVEIEVVAGGAVFSMLTRQSYGLGEDERLLAVSEHGHAYRFETGPTGITTLYEARELVGAEALPALVGSVDSIRLDLAHRSPAAAHIIAGAYRGALDAIAAGGDPASGIAAAREVHARHAPAGTFAGHLFRGSRMLDQER